MPAHLAVFRFEGPHEVFVSETPEAAASACEAIDIENGEYEFFGADGTLIEATTTGSRVVLSRTTDRHPERLRERLRDYLQQPRVALDPSLADDAPALARLLMSRQREERWSRWPRRLHRRFLGHGSAPT